MLSKKKQTNLKLSNGVEASQRFPAISLTSYSPGVSSNGQFLQGQFLQGQGSKSGKKGSAPLSKSFLNDSGTTASNAVKLEEEITKVNGKTGRRSSSSTEQKPETDFGSSAIPPARLLDGMITNFDKFLLVESEAQKERDLKKLLHCLSNWDSINDQTLSRLLKELKYNIESIDEKLNPLIQQILIGNWHLRSEKIVTQMETLVSELILLRPGFTVVPIHCFIAKFSLGQTNSTGENQAGVICNTEEQVFNILHRNLERIFLSFPMKQEHGMKTMRALYPYMGKAAHIHYCYVTNVLKSMEYLPDVKHQLLHVIIHKLARIDVNISKQQLEDFCENQSNRSFRIKKETGGHEEMFSMEIEDDPSPENPLIETLDLCLNLTFEVLHKTFKPHPEDNSEEEEERETKRKSLLNYLLQTFQEEILPTFEANNVQFLYFYLLSLQPSFLTSLLEFLWKNATKLNTSGVIRIQTMSYLSGILARAKFISIKTVKRWLTKLSDWANSYASQKNKSSHWSSVNVETHGPFYAVCQTIFYVFAFRNKELITSRKSSAFTRTLNLGRLVTSELNPLKACEEQIAFFFVDAAHQHQISYCRTVLERNQGATIPTICRESLSHISSEIERLAFNRLEYFFPFDPILLPRCKKWIEGIYNIYEPYFEELKIEKEEPNRSVDTEDSIEMELGSYNERQTSEFYCNGVIPFKCKLEVKNELENFID